MQQQQPAALGARPQHLLLLLLLASCCCCCWGVGLAGRKGCRPAHTAATCSAAILPSVARRPPRTWTWTRTWPTTWPTTAPATWPASTTASRATRPVAAATAAAAVVVVWALRVALPVQALEVARHLGNHLLQQHSRACGRLSVPRAGPTAAC